MNYIKPTFTFTPLNSARLAAGSCTTTEDDLIIIKDILGIDPSDSTVFATSEDCTSPIDTDMYCMFTSVDSGAAKVLSS